MELKKQVKFSLSYFSNPHGVLGSYLAIHKAWNGGMKMLTET